LSGPCSGAGTSSGRKGVQGGMRVVRGRGQHMKLGGKKGKKDSNMHKNTTCLSRCACAVDVWAGGLQGWHEARWTQRDLAERDVENRAVSRD